MMKIAQGAEAVLYQEGALVIKERLRKGYRLASLDSSLRKFRTKREAKILDKLEELDFPAPRLKEFSENRNSLIMDFIPGEKLRDVLLERKEHQQFAGQIGDLVGRLHNHNIIHGDLTTSNMIMNKESRLNLIDFGLSFFSEKIEDKAVDIFLLEKGLMSTHPEISDITFKKIVQRYKKTYPEAGKVLERLEQVKKRGRNKNRQLKAHLKSIS